MMEKLKLKKESVKSTEEAAPDATEQTDFELYVKALVEKEGTPPDLLLAHDEFNEFLYKPKIGKNVLTTERERNMRGPGHRARVRRVSGGRQTFTCGLILSPIHGVLKAYILGKTIGQKAIRRIRDEFGELLHIAQNTGLLQNP